MKELKVEYVDIEKVKPNEWNPNVQKRATFKRLVDSIREDGFIEPITVTKQRKKYRVIGGEHRWAAAKELGMDKIPVIVLEGFDEDRQKFLTVRLNVVKGRLDPLKLAELLADLSQKYDKTVMKKLMGFTDEQVFDRLYAEVTRTLPAEIRKGVDAQRAKINTIADLSNIVHMLMREYGSTVPQSFMFFVYGGRKHLLIRATNKTFKGMEKLSQKCQLEKRDMNEFFEDWLKEIA